MGPRYQLCRRPTLIRDPYKSPGMMIRPHFSPIDILLSDSGRHWDLPTHRSPQFSDQLTRGGPKHRSRPWTGWSLCDKLFTNPRNRSGDRQSRVMFWNRFLGEGILTSPAVHPKQEHRIRCTETKHGAVVHLSLIGIIQKSNTLHETFILEVAQSMPFLGSQDIIGIGFHHVPCHRVSCLMPCLRLPEYYVKLEVCVLCAVGGRVVFTPLSRWHFFTRLDRWPPRKASISMTRCKFLPESHYCIKPRYTSSQYAAVWGDLSVWEFRAESKNSNGLLVPNLGSSPLGHDYRTNPTFGLRGSRI